LFEKNMMKRFLTLCIASTWIACAYAQQKPLVLQHSIESVTVFPDRAQIFRTAAGQVSVGRSEMKLSGLSPYIDAKSIQVKAVGAVTIMGVQHQLDHLSEEQRQEGEQFIRALLAEKDQLLEDISARLDVLEETKAYLVANRDMGGERGLQVADIALGAEVYQEKMEQVRFAQLELQRKQKGITAEREKIVKQLTEAAGKRDTPRGEIIIILNSTNPQQVRFEVSYLVSGAGWYPSYDLHVDNIDKPMQLHYKANVFQNTQIDWKNVPLTFSTATPTQSGKAPELKKYLLDYGLRPPSYTSRVDAVNGLVTDEEGAPLPGVNVVVKGTSIGTITNMEGQFSITVPDEQSQLTFSSVGYISEERGAQQQYMAVQMQPDVTELQEIVVVGYGGDAHQALQGRMPGVSMKNEKLRIRGSSSIPVETVEIQNSTTVEFSVKEKNTVMSNGKAVLVEMLAYAIPAHYEYYAVPKVEQAAYLIAKLTNWQQYNLMEAEANIIFEGTYIGKTLLDVRYLKDTLEISLGKDKQVAVQRERVSQMKEVKFLSSKKVEERQYAISVRNNKGQPISIRLYDQVPVSTNEEIEVSVEEKSGGQLHEDTGEVLWDLSLQPGELKALDLYYAVKSPKHRALAVE
jgi:hypothetical protein